MTISGKVVKIHPELLEVRNLFNTNLSDKLGSKLTKTKSDRILASVIRKDLFDFDIVHMKNRKGFNIEWK